MEISRDKPLFKIAINSDGANNILTVLVNEITRQGNEIEEIKKQLGAMKGEDGILSLREKLNSQVAMIDKQMHEMTASGIEQQGRIKQLFNEMEKKTSEMIESSQAQVKLDVQRLKESNEKVVKMWGGENGEIVVDGKVMTPGEAIAQMKRCMETVESKAKVIDETSVVLETLKNENNGKSIAEVISDMCSASKQSVAAVELKEQVAQLKQQMEKQERILDQTGLSNMQEVPDFTQVTALAEALKGEAGGDPKKALENLVKKAMEEVVKENPHLATGKETAAIIQQMQNAIADGLSKMETIQDQVENCATKEGVMNFIQEINGVENPDGTAIGTVKCRCLACGRPKINMTMKTDATLLGILGYQPLPQTPKDPTSTTRVSNLTETQRPTTEGTPKTTRRAPMDERNAATGRLHQTPLKEKLPSRPRYPGTATTARVPLSKPK